MDQEFGSGIAEIFPSCLLEDPNNGCQLELVKLGMNSGYPVGAGGLTFFAALDHPARNVPEP